MVALFEIFESNSPFLSEFHRKTSNIWPVKSSSNKLNHVFWSQKHIFDDFLRFGMNSNMLKYITSQLKYFLTGRVHLKKFRGKIIIFNYYLIPSRVVWIWYGLYNSSIKLRVTWQHGQYALEHIRNSN